MGVCGNTMRTNRPPRTPSSSRMSPPYRLTMDRATARPRPDPPVSRFRDSSSLKNGRKTRSRLDSAMPPRRFARRGGAGKEGMMERFSDPFEDINVWQDNRNVVRRPSRIVLGFPGVGLALGLFIETPASGRCRTFDWRYRSHGRRDEKFPVGGNRRKPGGLRRPLSAWDPMVRRVIRSMYRCC